MSAALLRGAPAAQAVKAQAIDICSALSKPPVLAIVRTGSEADDLAYEKGIRGACAKCGVTVWTAQLPAYVPQDVLVRSVHRIGLDPSVDGVIVMCPRQYDAGLIGSAIGAKKDVDGMSFAEGGAFAPCTAAAVMEIISHYHISCTGKKVTVVGRGALTGAPIAKLLCDAGAVVSVCCRATENPQALCRGADILVSAAGKAGLIGADRLSPGQTVIDVGINPAPGGGICGDVDPLAAEIPAALTPVPGGVGAVTPYILALHTAQAAQNRGKK